MRVADERSFPIHRDGNARSQGLSIDLMRTAELAHARDVDRRTAFWSDYKEQASQLLLDAESRNEEPPELRPHPDDIEIDPVYGPKFRGPMDEEDLLKVNETIAMCDMLLMQEALDDRLGGYGEDTLQPKSGAWRRSCSSGSRTRFQSA